MVYLNREEAEEIVEILSEVKGKKISRIIEKLRVPVKRVVYERSPKKIEQLIHKAFREKRKIKMRHYSLSSDEVRTREVNILKMHRGCFIAYCNLREEERTFVVDRINAAALLDERYEIPKGWSSESIILDK